MFLLDIFWDVFVLYCVVIPLMLSPFVIGITFAILAVRKQMKQGKRLWKILKEGNGGTNINGNAMNNISAYNNNWRSSDYTTNPLYSNTPGNIYNRY